MTQDHDFVIGQGDTSPNLDRTLTDTDGNAIDISGFNRLEFHMVRAKDNNEKVNDDTTGNVSAVDAANGEVRYDWSTSDTDTAARYLGEFEVEYSDGEVQTFPADGHIDIKVAEELA